MTAATPKPWEQSIATACLVFADGTRIEGRGCGAEGVVTAEVVFNTAITGYQEILTDPSYLGQIVTFTFPHIGNVGTNEDDKEDLTPTRHIGAVGAIMRADITPLSNYRGETSLDDWMKARGIVGISGLDTRALTALVREKGAQHAVLAHDPSGNFDFDALHEKAKSWSGLEGLDLAIEAGSGQSANWSESPWVWDEGFGENNTETHHIVAIDYGVKRNILRLLAGLGAKVTIVPPKMDAQSILDMKPDGIFLSNGPGDPAATGAYAVPIIQELVASKIPVFGICLGHQMLALALGAKTIKMHQGHHGANHPVKDHTTNKVEIVSMNHGFAVDTDSLPDGVVETHISLFDGTNCGLELKGQPVFSVQHHPEASPGPQDSHYLFRRFADAIEKHKKQIA